MNSADRVLAALNLEEPDIVPIGEQDYDIGKVSETMGFTEKVFNGYCQNRIDKIRRNVDILSAFIEKLDLDIVPVSPSPPLKRSGIKIINKETWIDEWGAMYRRRNGIDWYIGPSLKDPLDVEKIEPPDPHDPGLMDGPRLLIRRFKGRRALAGHIPGPKIPYLARGIDGYNIDLFRNPSLAKKFMEMATEYNIELGKRLIEEGVDLIVMAGDVAYNRGPIVSIKHFREVFVPAIKKPVQVFHKLGVPVVKHSDGYLEPILEDLISTGIDGLHSLEPISGMDIGKVKMRYGDKICLWGNIDFSYTLSLKTEEDVVKEVKECINAAAPGGGFILSSSNSYAAGVKFENFLAMVKAGRKYGKYQLLKAYPH
ncbi:MAG: uroporphyrinogen decarboxylase family protein [Candidatus Bathyarchaeia archaeon]